MKSDGKPKFQPSKEEIDLFHQAMKDVKPISNDRLYFKPELKRKKKTQYDLEEKPAFYFESNITSEEVDHQSQLFYAQEGMNPRILKQLKRGQIPCEGQLDLHGLTVDAAEQILFEFLANCQAEGLRCVRIIHGKGYRNLKEPNPILKNKVNQWLRNSSYVLAFSSATPRDGGTGAIYLILKKK